MLFVDVLDTEKLKIQCPFCGATRLTTKGLKDAITCSFIARAKAQKLCAATASEDETVDEFDGERSIYESIEALDYPHSVCFRVYNDLPPFMCSSGFEGYIGLCQFTEEKCRKCSRGKYSP
jgi:hypothetical protein